MNHTQGHDVFVSFSFKDQQIAESVVNLLLNRYGITCWICTQDIMAGEHYKRSIVAAISTAQVVLMIQSESSVVSPEVPKEVSLALAKNKPVIPFVIDGSELTGDLEYDLLTVQRIDATKPTLEDRVEELAKQICQMIDRPFHQENTATRERLLPTPQVLPKRVFCGREDILKSMDAMLREDRVLFLTGIGGIGKTQIVKQYAKAHRTDYDTVVYATYTGSLRDMVVAEAPFVLEPAMIHQTQSDGTLESDDAFFARKLAMLKKCTDEKTLIILDNFDTENDPALPCLLEGDYRLLITTRCDYSRLYPTLKVDALSSLDSILAVFLENYQGFDVEEDDPALVELIELVNRHTYTVELLAQHMENSGQTPAEMVRALKENGILSMTEEVQQPGDRTQAAYEKLLKLYRVFDLKEEEKELLKLLSLMPLEGVGVKELRLWGQLTSNRLLKELETRSWIIRNTGGIALHPIIRDVIRHELPSTVENSRQLLGRILQSMNPTDSWHSPMARKEYLAKIAHELMAVFPQITPDTLQLYISAEALYSFGVRPREAVELAKGLYQYFLSTQGLMAYDTGWAAWKTGWAYLFNLRPEDALSNAQAWFKKAYEILSQITLTDPTQNGVYGQLLGNLSRVHLLLGQGGDPQHLKKGVEYALLDVALNEKWLRPGDPSYPKLAGGYIQLADAYIATGEYQKGLELAEEAYGILCGIYGRQDSDVLHAESRKVYALIGLERYEEALALSERVMEGYDIFYDALHFGRYEMLLQRIRCFRALGRQTEARQLYDHTRSVAEKLFAPGSAQLAELEALY